MTKRRGEKAGWIVGWFGGFIWVFLMSIMWVVMGKGIEGITGLALTGLGAVVVFVSAPWKHPMTPYWKLMLPVYAIFGVSVVWAVWSFGNVWEAGLRWWAIFLLFPLLFPFGTLGKRRWND